MTGRPRTAIATLAVGDGYRARFDRDFLPGWQAWCLRHGYDLFVIDQPIDRAADLGRKSIHWQKLLVPTLPQFVGYDRVVWIDADIMINARLAPDITIGVPEDRIGMVDATPWMTRADDVYNQYGRFLLLDRLWDSFGDPPPGPRLDTVIADMSVADTYRLKGFDPPVDRYVNSGVFVCSPRRHAGLLFEIYLSYDQDIWDYDNSAVSWELLRRDLVHALDPRFNAVWPWEAAQHYPFLFDLPTWNAHQDIVRACLNTAFRNNFFLHLVRGHKWLAPMIDAAAPNLAALVIQDYPERSASFRFLTCAEAENTPNVTWPF